MEQELRDLSLMVTGILSDTDFTDDERRGIEKVRERGGEPLRHNNNVKQSDHKNSTKNLSIQPDLIRSDQIIQPQTSTLREEAETASEAIQQTMGDNKRPKRSVLQPTNYKSTHEGRARDSNREAKDADHQSHPSQRLTY